MRRGPLPRGQKRRKWPCRWAGLFLAAMLCACTPAGLHAPIELPRQIPGASDRLAVYREMVKENIDLTDRLYDFRYVETRFIVDTDGGSAPVQTLINTAAAADYLRRYDQEASPTPGDLLRFVQTRFEFVEEPQAWQDVAETIASGRGDCKNLSLLLLAMLDTLGVPAYAGIANGHMWVVAGATGSADILEVDIAPARRSVYDIPGFYDMPLYRIYTARSEKRRRRQHPLPP